MKKKVLYRKHSAKFILALFLAGALYFLAVIVLPKITELEPGDLRVGLIPALVVGIIFFVVAFYGLFNNKGPLKFRN